MTQDIDPKTPLRSADETRPRSGLPDERNVEQWLVYGVVAVLLGILAYFSFVAPAMRDESAAVPTLEPGIQDALFALAATDTPTPTPPATATPRPTRDLAEIAAEAVNAPTPPAGGLSVAPAPAEAAVGSFDSQNKLGTYGDRGLLVGRLYDPDSPVQEDSAVDYVGGLNVSLAQGAFAESEIVYAALEMAGLSDLNAGAEGEWRVEMLSAADAEAWPDMTYESLLTAEMDGPSWTLPRTELATGRINVLEFSEQARATLEGRLREGGTRFAFRIRGPEAPGEDDNVFVWDTGYGGGFGTRPTLRVNFIPPPATPGPAPGEPTELPLVIWEAEPTPAPTTTPLPEVPPSLLRGNILFLSDRFGGSQLMVLEPNTGRVGRVTKTWPYLRAREREQVVGGKRVSTSEVPCGSGDATIIVDGDPVPNPDPARRCNQIVLSVDGGPFEEITQNGFTHYDPVLSPDGEWVAYVSQASGNDELWLIRTNGSDYRRLTDNTWEWDEHPSWSPDGTRLAFWSNREGRQQLYLLDVASGNIERLLESPYNDWNPVWVR